MVVVACLLTGAIAALVWARQTRWYELLFLGGWGITVTLWFLDRSWSDLGSGIARTVGGWFS